MTPNGSGMGVRKNFKLLKYENITYSFEARNLESFRENLLIKSRNKNIFEKLKLNRNLQTIPFKMMYNMPMLRHWFSNERWMAALNHLPLLFCKSVYKKS